MIRYVYTSTTTQDLSGPRSNGNDAVHDISQILSVDPHYNMLFKVIRRR